MLATEADVEAPIRAFAIATMFWGITGFLVGVVIAAQLAFPLLNLDLEWTTFGRLRPVHTSAVIFAFGGNALIGTSLYVVQRTCRARLFGGEEMGWFLFWGYQFFIVMAALGYVLGVTQGKEYAEPEWYVDIWLTVVWVTYLIGLRRHDHEAARSRTSTWRTGSTSPSSSPSRCCTSSTTWRCRSSMASASPTRIASGVQDAMIQWWYGHNAVGFFLTAGFLGMMYYFIPKQAERPIYSYRLSIVHFWSLIFLYIWAGPHHLHYTALPDWAQTLGMAFSVMLWMPSWGGMINGLMTLSGAWDKLRTDPGLRFSVTAVALLRHEHLRGPGDVDQGRQRAVATTPTGPSATCTPARSAGSASSPSARSTACSRCCGNSKGCIPSGWSPGTSGSRRSASCSTSPPCGSAASCRA